MCVGVLYVQRVFCPKSHASIADSGDDSSFSDGDSLGSDQDDVPWVNLLFSVGEFQLAEGVAVEVVQVSNASKQHIGLSVKLEDLELRKVTYLGTTFELKGDDESEELYDATECVIKAFDQDQNLVGWFIPRFC